MARKILYTILVAFLIQSCQNANQQEELMNKKWYSSKIDCIEFKDNQSYILYHREVKIGEVSWEFTGDNKFKLEDAKTGIKKEYYFEVEDSVLMFCYAENAMPQIEKTDTFFYHLNSKYEYWQRRELYYYGKIISKNEPLPYIKFEF